MPEPLSTERLAEIRDLNVDSCSADAPYNPDVWALIEPYIIPGF